MAMDPNQQPYGQQPTPQPSNPYGFITDTDHQPKRSGILKGGSFRSRLLAILGGGIILIILAIVVGQLVFGSKSGNTTLLVDLVAQQQEIIRISNIGLKDATDSSVLAFTQTTQSTVRSQQTSLTSYLKSKGVKMTKEDYAKNFNNKTDATLSTAKTNGDYETVLMSTLKALLVTYSKDIKKSYDNASNQTSKNLLGNSYNSVVTLLKN